jgi:hypothetical protein
MIRRHVTWQISTNVLKDIPPNAQQIIEHTDNEAEGSSKPFVFKSSKTCEVGHPCNSATLLLNRQIPTIYMVITQQLGRQFIANLGQSFKLNTTRSVEVHPPHVGRLAELCIFCIWPCRGRNPHSLAELPAAHTAFMLSPQTTSVANDYCLLRGLCACCPTAPHISF